MRKDTKAQDFPKKIKEKIAERDSVEGWPCCVKCGRPAPPENPTEYSNAHYIPRSQGGLGIEENGLTLCLLCHREYDQTANRGSLRNFFREYLQKQYPNWDESTLYYRRNCNA